MAAARARIREPLATPAQVAEYTGLSPVTLKQMRSQGRGPAFKKVGRLVRYDLADVDAWIAEQTTS